MLSENKVHVKKSKVHGLGVFTKVSIKKNQEIFAVGDIQKFFNKEDYITKLGRKVNHQASGNCILDKGKNDKNLYVLVALRNIDAGEELTSDYTIAPPIFSRDITGYKELQ